MPRHSWPTEQFAFALNQLDLTATNRRVLQAFLDAPEHTLTAHALSHGASLPGGWSAANLRIGELARKFRPYLGALQPEEDGEPHWWRYVATGVWRGNRFHWTLRPELQNALLALGWKIGAPTFITEEITPDVEVGIIEGSVQRISVNAYERSADARRACLEVYGYTCIACDTAMYEVYGHVAENLIHVHHLIPLSNIGQSYQVDGRTDLVPVCPNCHAVMHRRNPPYTVNEVREMLARVRERRGRF